MKIYRVSYRNTFSEHTGYAYFSTARNLAKTNKVMRIAAETERIYEENVYKIQYLSRKQRKNLK